MKNIIIFLFYYISRVTNDFWIKFAAVHIFSRQSEFPSSLQPHRFRLKQPKFVYIIFYIQGCLSNNQIALIFQLLAQRFQSISVFESSRVIPTLDGHMWVCSEAADTREPRWRQSDAQRFLLQHLVESHRSPPLGRRRCASTVMLAPLTILFTVCYLFVTFFLILITVLCCSLRYVTTVYVLLCRHHPCLLSEANFDTVVC